MWTPLAALALVAPSFACPTVATGTPQGLTYDVARVAIARDGERTTFTVSVNPTGEAQDFALVMPIPGDLDIDSVKTLDSEIFERLEGQTGILEMPDAGCSTPDFGFRHPCPGDYGEGGGSDGADEEADDGSYGNVEVEAQFLVGEYQITILSATESVDLFNWLAANEYHLDTATIPVLEDYIDQDMRFLAAKVADEATGADGSSLSPLQMAYDSPMFGIPIRLAAQSSPGRQDMLIYAMTAYEGGVVGISNYDRMTVRDTCIWSYDEQDTSDFGDFYEERFNAAWEEAGSAGWAVEWAGGNWDCNPCSGVQATPEDLMALGVADPGHHYLTRLHMRYTDQTADEDLVLYSSLMDAPEVMTFAQDTSQNRWCIDPCEEEKMAEAEAEREARIAEGEQAARERMAELEAECPDEDTASGDDDDDDGVKSGCATAAPAVGALGLGLVALAAVRRRRRDD